MNYESFLRRLGSLRKPLLVIVALVILLLLLWIICPSVYIPKSRPKALIMTGYDFSNLDTIIIYVMNTGEEKIKIQKGIYYDWVKFQNWTMEVEGIKTRELRQGEVGKITIHLPYSEIPGTEHTIRIITIEGYLYKFTIIAGNKA